MINFTDTEINKIKDIISRYTTVSGELHNYQEQANEIQEKVIELNKKLEDIKLEEKTLMDTLHNLYGDFGLQEVYENLNK